MKSIAKWMIAALACVVLSGCISPKAYVDPQYRKAALSQIQPAGQPVPVRVEVEFQQNGTPAPRANSLVREHVARTLTATGVFAPADDPATPAVISVVANNIADTNAAVGSGFKTGLTFGAAGSTVTDGYRFTFTYRDAGGKERQKSYEHAIHTTLGKVSAAPVNAEPTTLALAFEKVAEDVTLNFVKDLQDEGAVSGAPAARRK